MITGTAVYPSTIRHIRERIRKEYLVLLLFHDVFLIFSEKRFTGETIRAEQATAMAEKNHTTKVTFEK